MIKKWLIKKSKRKPYFHLPNYMKRYWLFGGSARDPRPEDERGWCSTWLDSLIGKWIAARIHFTVNSDDDRYLHDHPWWNISVILQGQYYEILPYSQNQNPYYDKWSYKVRLRKPGDIVFRRARTRHRLVLQDGPVYSLFIMGRKSRSWGFHTPKGWLHWSELEKQEPERFGIK